MSLEMIVCTDQPHHRNSLATSRPEVLLAGLKTLNTARLTLVLLLLVQNFGIVAIGYVPWGARHAAYIVLPINIL